MRENWCTAEGAHRRVILHMTWPASVRPVHEHGVIADQAIVGDVRVGHDQIVAAEARDAAALDRAAIHGAEFAKLVRVADFERNALARVGQILRIAANRAEWTR